VTAHFGLLERGYPVRVQVWDIAGCGLAVAVGRYAGATEKAPTGREGFDVLDGGRGLGPSGVGSTLIPGASWGILGRSGRCYGGKGWVGTDMGFLLWVVMDNSF
jgi:hypothetical protein